MWKWRALARVYIRGQRAGHSARLCLFFRIHPEKNGVAGESEHIKNRLTCHSPVYPMKQLPQKLTKTTAYWTGGRTEQQEAEEGLSIGNIKVSLSSMKTIFSL